MDLASQPPPAPPPPRQDAGVPHRVQVPLLAQEVEGDAVAAAISRVRDMHRLMQIAHHVNHDSQRQKPVFVAARTIAKGCRSVTQCVDEAANLRAPLEFADRGIEVDVVPRRHMAPAIFAADLVGPGRSLDK